MRTGTANDPLWYKDAQRARSAPDGSPERDYYVWSDTDQRYQQARLNVGIRLAWRRSSATDGPGSSFWLGCSSDSQEHLSSTTVTRSVWVTISISATGTAFGRRCSGPAI